MSTLDIHPEPMILRVAHAIARYIGFGDDEETFATRQQPIDQPPPPAKEPRAALRLVKTEQVEEVVEHHPSHKWRRHPQLRAFEAPISSEVRNGRHDVVRGLYAASAGALEVALEHFIRAARNDEVDLTAVPGFWQLTRGQMQVAVTAYEQVQRFRDAAALDAQIETIFRPSLVGANLAPIIPRKQVAKAATN